MRRLALLLPLPLLAPLPVAPQTHDAFCAGLLHLVQAAPSGFAYVDRGQRVVPGSVEERRGTLTAAFGPPRAAYHAMMLRAPAAQHPNPVEGRFHGLQAQIGHCLPGIAATPVTAGEGGAHIAWTTDQAVILLRREDGQGGASTAEVELSVAARW
jgi:hypothetical protein